jgi:hypothetical protein
MNTDNEQLTEAYLRSLPVSGGFTVPNGYMDRLRNHVLKATVGNLSEREMQVPEGYFKDARSRILAQTVQAASPKVVPLWYRSTWIQYAAASVLLVAGTLGWLFYTGEKDTASMAAVSNEEILLYLEREGVQDLPAVDVVLVAGEPESGLGDAFLQEEADVTLLTIEL